MSQAFQTSDQLPGQPFRLQAVEEVRPQLLVGRAPLQHVVDDYQQRMADRHMRGIDRAHIGTTLRDPFIDYAKIAQGMGVQAIGPITDPKDLAPALQRAVAIVKSGEPALVDVVTQGR